MSVSYNTVKKFSRHMKILPLNCTISFSLFLYNICSVYTPIKAPWIIKNTPWISKGRGRVGKFTSYCIICICLSVKSLQFEYSVGDSTIHHVTVFTYHKEHRMYCNYFSQWNQNSLSINRFKFRSLSKEPSVLRVLKPMNWYTGFGNSIMALKPWEICTKV